MEFTLIFGLFAIILLLTLQNKDAREGIKKHPMRLIIGALLGILTGLIPFIYIIMQNCDSPFNKFC